MKKFKKPLVIIASFLLLSIGALAAIPYFFKDKIIALIKENINESLYAQLILQMLILVYFVISQMLELV